MLWLRNKKINFLTNYKLRKYQWVKGIVEYITVGRMLSQDTDEAQHHLHQNLQNLIQPFFSVCLYAKICEAMIPLILQITVLILDEAL